MGEGGQLHAQGTLPLGRRTVVHCTGRCVGPRAGEDGCGKSRPNRSSKPRTVQPLANRYTDYVIRTAC